MAGKKGRKGYRGRPSVPIEPHAMERFREHWPHAAHLYDSEIRFLLSDQIVDALGRDDYIIAPGGIYVPVSVFGEDGYAVLLNQVVQTVMPTAWCLAIDATRIKKNDATS